jgi:hypothetical protein
LSCFKPLNLWQFAAIENCNKTKEVEIGRGWERKISFRDLSILFRNTLHKSLKCFSLLHSLVYTSFPTWLGYPWCQELRLTSVYVPKALSQWFTSQEMLTGGEMKGFKKTQNIEFIQTIHGLFRTQFQELVHTTLLHYLTAINLLLLWSSTLCTYTYSS